MTTISNDIAADDAILLDCSNEVLAFLWQNFARRSYGSTMRVRTAFVTFLRTRLIDPDLADEIEWCENCDRPGDGEDYSTIQGGGRACKSCVEDNYYTCDSCEELSYGTTSTLDDTDVCERCCENYYSWCDDCDGYYGNGDDSDHGHKGCECESPDMIFTVRNDGDEPLTNDTRVTITLPAGVIDDEGMSRIRRHLMDKGMYDATYLLTEVGPEWQTKQGNFSKRLSRLAYNNLRLAMAPEDLSRIGVIAREHSTSVDFSIETTRNLNLSAEDFYHAESCWWQSYSEGRCALKSNGGFGLRSFDEHGNVTGRAWVLPLTGGEFLIPTFETQTPSAFVVFNGYGALSNWTPARIMSHMTGWTYRKIQFGCGPMFINSDSGYLIAPEDIASRFNDNNWLSLSADVHSSLFETEQVKANSERVLANV